MTRIPIWLLLLLAFHPSAGFTQEIGRAEKIEVTGSRIKRVDLETPAPVQVITRADIEISGKETVADVIRGIPADNNGSIPLSFDRGFAPGGSAVSLRGLSAGSTLVLVNGRRTAPYGLADDGNYEFVNLSTIPLDAVERIEVLKDGASAIYGSDAIAGVVNIILRNDYQGATIRGSWGTTRYGDGENARLSLTAGTGDIAKDGYNFLLNVEAAKQSAILQRDRKDRAWIGDSDMRHYGYGIVPYQGAPFSPMGGYIVPAQGPTLASSSSFVGAVRDPVTTQWVVLPGCASTYALPDNVAGCLWARSDWVNIWPEEKSLSVLARGTWQMAPNLQGYFEASVYRNEVSSSGFPWPLTSAWINPSTLELVNTNALPLLGAGHPDNPFGMRARVRYAAIDVGPSRRELETTMSRAVGGVKGSLGMWDFDSALFWAQSRTHDRSWGILRDSVVRSLLDGTNPLGYYRLGINAYLNTPEMYAALAPPLESTAETSVSSWDIKATRELMSLAGGPLALALGAEAREEKIDEPLPPYSGDLIGFGYYERHLSRRVYSAFGELLAPLLPGLEVSAAARTDRYSDFGRSTTPKLGVKWMPAAKWLLRGTYSEGFRAPSAAEGGDSVLAFAGGEPDPVRCPITGAFSDCLGARFVELRVGSPSAKPQRSKSYTAGFVFEPARDSSIAVDYWWIQRTNEFTWFTTRFVFSHLALFPETRVIRQDNDLPGIPNSGSIEAVMNSPQNVGKTETSGVDLDARFRFAIGSWGRISADLLWTYIRDFKKTLGDDQLTVDFAGTHGPTGLSSNAGTPQHRGSLTLTWENGPYTLASTTTYVSGVKNVEFQNDTEGGCLNRLADGQDAPDGCRVGGFTTTSLFGRYRFSKQLEVFGTIQNLFDRIAPLDPQTYGAWRYNTAFHVSGAIGRQYSIGARYTFR